MNSIWMLAAAQPAEESPDVVTMEPAEETQETATEQNGANGTDQTPAPREPGNLLYQMFPFLILIVLMYLLLFRGPPKKQQEHQKMVSSLKKNDRVRTVGGILGTVVDVRDDEIVIKIDESTNTKIRVSPSAVGTVLSEEKK